ncbi:MAG TPA: hypothetical protein VGM88_16345 [Kofleriaceae bacterium]|jgi:hypothetical protein
MWKGTLIAIVAMGATARADKLDDFKEAVANIDRGCKSIPYSDQRSNCDTQQSYVHDYCDGDRGPVRCAVNETRRLKDAVDREQRALEDLRKQRSDVDGRVSSAPDDQARDELRRQLYELDKQIDEQQKKVRQAQDDLEKRKDLVAKAIDTIGKCIDYRRAVRNIFDYAHDKAGGEGDPDIKPLAQQLRAKWDEEKSGHEEQIQNRENSKKTCEDERP